MQRGTTIVAVSVLAMLMLFVARAGGQTPAATGTPAASPGASPAATPGATPGATPVADLRVVEGQALSQSLCLVCHTIDGRALVGPTWKGLYGSEVTLEDGSTVVADDAYIRESILEPNAKIHKGFPPAMAPFGSLLTEEQIEDIIAYIKTLK